MALNWAVFGLASVGALVLVSMLWTATRQRRIRIDQASSLQADALPIERQREIMRKSWEIPKGSLAAPRVLRHPKACACEFCRARGWYVEPEPIHVEPIHVVPRRTGT
jgi:hypothetical protein